MNARVNVGAFGRAADLCGQISRRGTKPILKHTLIKSLVGNRIDLHASDGNVIVTVSLKGDSVEVTPDQHRPAVVDAKRLSAVFQALDKTSSVVIGGERKKKGRGKKATFETSPREAGMDLFVHSDDTSFRLVDASEMVEDFPTMGAFDNDVVYEIPLAVLLHLFERTRFAMPSGSEQHRYGLSNLRLELSDGLWRAVTTDGKRMAVASAPGPAGVSFEVLFQSEMVDAIIKASRKITGTAPQCQIAFGERGDQTRAQVSVEDIVLVSPVFDKFPPYKDVIPEGEPANRFRIDRNAFLAELQKVMVIAPSRADPVAMTFREQRVDLTWSDVNSTNPGFSGEAHAVVQIAESLNRSDHDVSIGVNAGMLIEGLSACNPAERVTVDLSADDKHPVVLRVGDEYLYILMPVDLTALKTQRA